MSGWQIRKATAADQSACVAINKACMPEVGSMDAQKFDFFLEVSPFFMVVEIDDAVTGLLVGLTEVETDYPSPNYKWFCERHDAFAYIDRIALSEACRGMGIGVGLYEEFERWARDNGKPVMSAEVNTVPDNPRSHRFHQMFGFDEVGREQPYGGAEEVAMYDKILV